MTNNNQDAEGVNSFGGSWDDARCFNWEKANGIHLENPQFVKMYQDTAKYITDIVTFDKFTDLGGGMGAYSKAMRDIGKEVHYYDANILHHEYASEHKAANRYYYGDFTKMVIKGEMVAMIEVAEHIEDERLIPFLQRVQCKYFHFSSTPHKSNMDVEWGHINIKSEKQWIEVFESCGYTMLLQLTRPTNWSLLFKK